MGITRLIIPPYPGLFSALGLLLANNRVDYVRSIERALKEIGPGEVMQIYREMEARARQEFASQAIESTGLRFERTADLRVGFMRDELSLPFPDRLPAT